MYQLFSTKSVLSVAFFSVAFFLLLIVTGYTMYAWFQSTENVWVWQFESRMIFMAISLDAVVITFLANKPWFFRWTWPITKVLIGAKEITNITGEWQGHIFSNFLIHKKVHDYCKMECPKPPLDNWQPTDDDFFRLKKYPAKIFIQMSYAAIKVDMRVFDDQGLPKSKSYSVASSAEIIQEGQHRRFGRIDYVYKSQKSNDKLDIEHEDDKEHYGSAQLDLIMSGDDVLELQGTYWTKRNWSKGRNTGGRMIFSKTSS